MSKLRPSSSSPASRRHLLVLTGYLISGESIAPVIPSAKQLNDKACPQLPVIYLLKSEIFYLYLQRLSKP
jgi:hypothetical protein